ncbi:MAG: class II aldolase/adducin family protein [Candidatus Humimicrobiaceae bacterium]
MEKLERSMDELIRYGKMMSGKNLVVGPGGNTSFKDGNICYITPSGLDFNEIKPEDLVGVDIDTKLIVYGNKKPSSEISMHIKIYKARPDISVIFHSHPPVTIGIIGAGAKVSALFPDFALFLGQEIPVIDYTTPCTEKLADMVSEAIVDNDAVTMLKHGLTVVGKNFKEAWIRTVLIEETAKMVAAARSIGSEAIMTSKEIDDMNNLEIEKYRKKIMEES